MLPTNQKSTIGPNIIDHKATVSELPTNRVYPTVFQVMVSMAQWGEILQHMSCFSSLVRLGKGFFQALLVLFTGAYARTYNEIVWQGNPITQRTEITTPILCQPLMLLPD